MPQFQVGPLTVLLFLSTINMVNFIDRGIVPGAPVEFSEFISRTLHKDCDSQGVWLGLLTSSFIGCYSIASLVFGHLVRSVRPFRLLGAGLSIWLLALVLSGLAQWLADGPATFYFFLFARALSGVGEAAFQCIVPPYVEDFAPPGAKTLWLGVFFTAIPTGTALGFVYGAAVASSVGWGWAYLLEVVMTAPLVALSFWLPPAELLVARRAAAAPRPSAPLLADDDAAAAAALAAAVAPLDDGSSDGEKPAGGAPPPTVWGQLWWLLRDAPFMLVVLGYGAYTFTTQGISAFGPLFLLGLGDFTSELEASTSFGLVVALGGVVGTPLGGWLTDRIANRGGSGGGGGGGAADGGGGGGAAANLRSARVLVASITLEIGLATAVLVAAAFAANAQQTALFLILLGVGILLAFGTSAGITRAVMLLVPDPQMRAFAIAIETLLLHLFGDVPSPVVVGALKDAIAPSCSLAPNCGNATDPGSGAAAAVCANPADRDGLFATLLLTTLWMLWTVGLWAACIAVLLCRRPPPRATINEP